MNNQPPIRELAVKKRSQWSSNLLDENTFSRWKQSKQATRQAPLLGDEYTRYCALPRLSQDELIGSAIEWWLQPKQKRDFPNLYKMAIDMLSIPAMAASVERLWSSAGLTQTDRRNQLAVEYIEYFECLKSWRDLRSFDCIGQWKEEDKE
jgi:hypothetical protein